VLALALIEPSAASRSAAKLALFSRMVAEKCVGGQYQGFLLEPKLGYHNASADATLTRMTFDVHDEEWADVEVVITTGKDMGVTLYTVDLFQARRTPPATPPAPPPPHAPPRSPTRRLARSQRDGPGVLTYEVGKEETGTAGIKVSGWPLRDASSFDAPYPGFTDRKARAATAPRP
jgi:hypothetical protein